MLERSSLHVALHNYGSGVRYMWHCINGVRYQDNTCATRLLFTSKKCHTSHSMYRALFAEVCKDNDTLAIGKFALFTETCKD